MLWTILIVDYSYWLSFESPQRVLIVGPSQNITYRLARFTLSLKLLRLHKNENNKNSNEVTSASFLPGTNNDKK